MHALAIVFMYTLNITYICMNNACRAEEHIKSLFEAFVAIAYVYIYTATLDILGYIYMHRGSTVMFTDIASDVHYNIIH